MKKSYYLKKFGLRITEGRHPKEFGLRPKAAVTDEIRSWAKENKKAILIEESVSLGSSLAKVIKFLLPKRIWMQADLLKCGCDKYESRMNRWGFYACFHKRKQIVNRLKQQSYRMGKTGVVLQHVPDILIGCVSYLMLSCAFMMEACRFLLLVALPKSSYDK
jgi:hypothetical protein